MDVHSMGDRSGLNVARLPDHATLHEFFEIRHLACVQERVDDLPVGSVPADQQDFPGVFCKIGLQHDGCGKR